MARGQAMSSMNGVAARIASAGSEARALQKAAGGVKDERRPLRAASYILSKGGVANQ